MVEMCASLETVLIVIRFGFKFGNFLLATPLYILDIISICFNWVIAVIKFAGLVVNILFGSHCFDEFKYYQSNII